MELPTCMYVEVGTPYPVMTTIITRGMISQTDATIAFPEATERQQRRAESL